MSSCISYKTKRLTTSVLKTDYEQFKELLIERNQGITEAFTYGLGSALENENVVIKKAPKLLRETVTISMRCSDYLYNKVSSIAKKKGLSRVDIMAFVFYQIIGYEY